MLILNKNLFQKLRKNGFIFKNTEEHGFYL